MPAAVTLISLVQPENVIHMPDHMWYLIDLGCAGNVGALPWYQMAQHLKIGVPWALQAHAVGNWRQNAAVVAAEACMPDHLHSGASLVPHSADSET